MKPKGFQLSKTTKWLLYSSLGCLFVSGVAWLILHYFFMEETEFASVPSPYEELTLQVHGTFVLIFLIVFGALFPLHITRALKARQNFMTGVTMLAFILLLIVTGYLLYYTGNEFIRNLSSIVHSLFGLVVPFFLWFHIIKGKNSIGSSPNNYGGKV